MAVSKEQVLAALANVPSPDGTPLPDARVLSDIVVSDGKVFFSLTVDAAAVNPGSPCARRAEDAVRAIPGVQSALVALTAERAAGAARTWTAARACCDPAARRGRAGGARPSRRQGTAGHSRR